MFFFCLKETAADFLKGSRKLKNRYQLILAKRLHQLPCFLVVWHVKVNDLIVLRQGYVHTVKTEKCDEIESVARRCLPAALPSSTESIIFHGVFPRML